MRRCLLALTLALAYGGFVVACPEWTYELGLDVWNYSAEAAEQRQNSDRFKELTEQGDRVKRRLELKGNIAQDLIDGHTTFAAAVQAYLELNFTAPEIMASLRIASPGQSDEEIVGRQVIAFALGRLEEDSSLRHEIRCRLEAELRELLKKGMPRKE